jgi:hypothetical protein
VATMTSTLATYFSTMTEHADRMEVSSGVPTSFNSKKVFFTNNRRECRRIVNVYDFDSHSCSV